MRLQTFGGADTAHVLPALARLRIEVFRAWPYLYDGAPADEQAYLRHLAASPSAGLVVAFDGEEPVGCATCQKLAEASESISRPFRDRGLDPARFFYFGESVLRPRYRGQGIGVAFFEAREAHARAVSDCDFATFCAVVRPAEHPLRPAGDAGLTEFWRHRGFTPYPDLACTMEWKQMDAPGEVENRLSFWIKPLRNAPLP